MVTATNGTIRLIGKSGTQYGASVYVSDVIGAPVTFNLVGAAVSTSPNFLTFPEDVALADMSILTGPTVMTLLVPYQGDSPIAGGKITGLANVLTTLNSRSFTPVIWKGGVKMQIFQA
jgi:hypothetical protein